MKLFSRATRATLRRMRTRISLLTLGLASVGIAAVVACGSSPKAEPVTPPSPPEMPETPAAAPDAGGETAAAAADAGAADAAGDKAAQCSALVNDANSELDAERIKVDTVCKKDSDCMPIKGHACGFVCTTGAIPKGEEKEWTTELTNVKNGPCKKWEEMDCAKVTPPRTPTCSQDGKKPACDKGRCILK